MANNNSVILCAFLSNHSPSRKKRCWPSLSPRLVGATCSVNYHIIIVVNACHMHINMVAFLHTHTHIHSEQLLSVPAVNRNEKHDLTLELILTLFRNVLSVQNAAIGHSSRADDRTFIHEQILLKFHSELVCLDPSVPPLTVFCQCIWSLA